MFTFCDVSFRYSPVNDPAIVDIENPEESMHLLFTKVQINR